MAKYEGTYDYTNATVSGISPLTTKGDLYTYDTADTRLPVGNDDQVLVADSSQTTGMKWADGVSTNFLNKLMGYNTGPNINSISFSTDVATTKTGFTYDSQELTYVGSAGSVELKLKSHVSINNPIPKKFTNGYMNSEYYIATVYDECDDSSVDSTLWSKLETNGSATISEDTEKLTFTPNSGTDVSLLTDSTNGLFTDETIIFYLGYSNSFLYMTINVYDGTNRATIINTSSGFNYNVDNPFILKFDKTNGTVDYWVRTSWKGQADVSSVTGDWRLEFRFYKSGGFTGSETTDIYFLRKITGSETTTLTESLSADDGTNYDTITNGSATFTNQGMKLKPKISGTVQSGELFVVKKINFYGETE